MGILRRDVFTSLLGFGAALAPQTGNIPGGNEPTVLSGQDLGFRVDGIGRDGVPVGALVVRVGGKWVTPQFQPGLRKAT